MTPSTRRAYFVSFGMMLIATFFSQGFAQVAPSTPLRDQNGNQETSPPLPKVLLLGDSISMGYTPFVIDRMKGVADVSRPKANCGDTRAGIAKLDLWLGDTKWNLIHFNWGLHDLCYRNPESKTQGNRDKIKGTLSVSLTDYEKNLESLVERLKKTGARLVWASTTIVPEGEAGRFVGDDLKYNLVAEKIMRKHGVLINDLHAISKDFGQDKFVAPGNVHFTKEGYALLADQVAATLKTALTAKSP